MKGKIYTPDEATRMLPLVSRIADDIVATYAKVHGALREYEAAKEGTASNPGSEGEALVRRLDADVARLLDRFQGLIEEVEALGGTVKDYERGCVDFYGEIDGEIVYLCWQRGEDTICFWHKLDEGYKDRHRLELPSVA